MARKKTKQHYRINTTKEAKAVALEFLKALSLDNAILFGLPEIDDRYHIWRVPLLSKQKVTIGEVVIDAITSLINVQKSSTKNVLESRLLGRNDKAEEKKRKEKDTEIPKMSTLMNTVGLGDCELLLSEMPAESVDLVFTSPPYYNARPEYADYLTYEEYLLKLKKVIHQCHRVLNDGRFILINISPVLIRRSSRSEASKRIAVPFDVHKLLTDEGFEFVDDIIWVKPEGAGWATGRGRRFAADRNPVAYKPVPVTEYILVYRKKTSRLIDWLIRKHPDQKMIQDSKIADGYEKTNIWKIHPAYSKLHPAIFPLDMAEKVIKYYSFKNDVVLDPFAGIGTLGKAAVKHHRRFVLFEKNPKYMDVIVKDIHNWLHHKVKDVNFINIKNPLRPE